MIDLTNQRFGNLIVVSFSHRNFYGDSVWNCVCDCENLYMARLGHLRSNRTTSCKSCSIEKSVKIKVGDVYGRLKVIERRKELEKDALLYECLCDCGNVVIVRGQSLRQGATKSCGCLKRELATKHGKHGTKEYRKAEDVKRREKKKILDSAWTLEMEFSLRELQCSCILCNSTDTLIVDHVRPLSKGYGLSPGNAIILCQVCNNIKNAKDIYDLSDAVRNKILLAAEQFRIWWDDNGESYHLNPF